MTKNRQISTRFNDEQATGMIVLEAVKELDYGTKALKPGETVKVSRSEAKRLLTLRRDAFRIKMD